MFDSIVSLLKKSSKSDMFCTKITMPCENLCLEVEPIGIVNFPITPRVAKSLIVDAELANYGKRRGMMVLFLDLPHVENTYLLFLMRKGETDDITQEEKKAIAFEQGRTTLKTVQRELAPPAPKFAKKDMRKLRMDVLHWTQEEFAAFMNVDIGTVRHWEQGLRKPSGVVHRLHKIISKKPSIVETCLKEIQT